MALIQKISEFLKKRSNKDFFSLGNKTKALSQNRIILISLLFLISLVFFISQDFVENKMNDKSTNLKNTAKSSEFLDLSNFLISKINSPYTEKKYIIQNNDSIEKILNKFKVRNEDIKIISFKLKQKKLSSIYSGRKLSLILKKLDEKKNTVVNLIYPINNTLSIEVRKIQDDFIVIERILKLNKKEIVVKNIIKNNLYSSAIEKLNLI